MSIFNDFNRVLAPDGIVMTDTNAPHHK
ncbi:hypothetical protein MTBLM1_40166 [Rhodospirillaceae bacterium LM-1]|nr:hypothetical protein MTBLM1_40166 [Rhodospirillaceae bacterium LM-1]